MQASEGDCVELAVAYTTEWIGLAARECKIDIDQALFTLHLMNKIIHSNEWHYVALVVSWS